MARFRLLLFYFAERPCDASLLPYLTDSQSTSIYSWLKRSHLGAPPFRLTEIWIPIAELRSHNWRNLLQNILKAENSNQIQIHWDQYQMFSLNKEETGSGSIYSYCGLFSIDFCHLALPPSPVEWWGVCCSPSSEREPAHKIPLIPPIIVPDPSTFLSGSSAGFRLVWVAQMFILW